MTAVDTTESAAPEDRPPRWDLETLFPSVDDRSFQVAFEAILAGVDRLAALYEQHDVRGGQPRPATDADAAVLDAIIDETNALRERVDTMTSYLYGKVTTDSRDDLANARYAEIQTRLAPLGPLAKRLAAWIVTLGTDDLIERSARGPEHGYVLRQAAEQAARQMGEGEESLAAELRSSGSLAWARLHGDLSSQIVVTRASSTGETEQIPMTQARGLATHPDAEVRRSAYEGELAAWAANAVPFAAAMNGVKGERSVLSRRRGYADELDPVLASNHVDRATLDAMTDAVRASLGAFREYLRTKARLLGHDGGLPWWDLFAPLHGAQPVSWSTATDLVGDAFAAYSPALRDLADRAFAERWVDAEIRDGKRGGAYCAGVGSDVSRIMMNFDESFDSVSTLAHELGHAYHNVTLAVRTPLQRQLPMALAETASIFCETLLFESALAHAATDTERLALLDTNLVGATQVVVDIHSRFVFEQEVFRRRRRTTLSVTELCEAMSEAQETAYGDGLAADARHPYMWAVKPHYYSTDYYNWPYTFGLLFGLGLHAAYHADPERFRHGYDDLLSSAGMADAAALGARFGIDVRDGAFWDSSLAVLRGHVDEYLRLAAAAG